MSLKTFIFDPDAKLKFGFDWSPWLASGSCTIVTSTWAITPTGPTLEDEDNDDTETVVWVSGCTNSTRYILTNHIVISDGQEEDRSMVLQCRNR